MPVVGPTLKGADCTAWFERFRSSERREARQMRRKRLQPGMQLPVLWRSKACSCKCSCAAWSWAKCKGTRHSQWTIYKTRAQARVRGRLSADEGGWSREAMQDGEPCITARSRAALAARRGVLWPEWGPGSGRPGQMFACDLCQLGPTPPLAMLIARPAAAGVWMLLARNMNEACNELPMHPSHPKTSEKLQ